MAHFQVPVELYMTRDVVSVLPSDTLAQAHDTAIRHDVTSLPVMEGDRLLGVISVTDLLRAARREVGSSVEARVLQFPSKPVSAVMTADVWTVPPGTYLADAAGIMRKEFIHRLFVIKDGAVAGVVSTTDLLRAIEEKRVNHCVGDYMSSPVFTIRDQEPLGEAVERLDRGHASGLVVVEDGWPVGIFSKREALDARDLPRSVAMGDVMSPKILVLPSTTTLHRAAAQASALGVRRVVIQDGGEVAGILSGLDFARAVTG
jgi:CBS domain-containing protein